MPDARCWIHRLRPGRLMADRRGTSGIEFALIAPILLMVYLGAFELSVGFNVSRKVAQAASTVADILSQKKEISPTGLDGMKNVAASIMAPFGMTGSTLKMTGINVTGTGTGVVAWSRDGNGGTPYAIGSPVTVPNDMPTVNTFVVKTELTVPHELALFMASDVSDDSIKTINISQTYFYRQRVGLSITCTLCQ